MNLRRMQHPLFAVAALAVFALAAVILLSTGAPAYAATTTPATHGEDTNNPSPQQAATPEACPAEGEAAPVVDSGHYALFDVYWNPVEKELTNNPCPPSVEHVPEQAPVPPSRGNPGKPGHPAMDNRSPSSINIDETVIHIPSSAMVTLTESEYPKDRYKAVWDADNEGGGDGIVWVLEACPPNGTPPDGGLCISYSAALLDPDYWNDNILYLVGHVHQVDIDKQDQRYVLVYDVTGDRPVLRWDSSDGRLDTVPVAPGGYDRPKWFFTSRGAYEFQVHITGNPNTTRSDARSKDPSVTSDVRTYILHVGAESDLGVAMTVTPESASPNNEVTIGITASNAGPDEAEETTVKVTLPEGLTRSSHEAPAGTEYRAANGIWTINNFAGGASETLTIKATVDAQPPGKELDLGATISATETVTTVSGTFEVPVPDPDPSNNAAAGTVTVTSLPNVDPMFQVTASVPENSPAGTIVGDPIGVREPDGDTLTFSLTGEGADDFTVETVDGGAQIKVADGANLDYETTQSYDLELGVSDGKDDAGDSDDSIDHTIAVAIEIIDVPELTLSVSDRYPSLGEAVTWKATLLPLPTGTAVTYHWEVFEQDDTEHESWDVVGGAGPEYTFTGTGSFLVILKVRVSASYTDDDGTHELGPVESGWVRWE